MIHSDSERSLTSLVVAARDRIWSVTQARPVLAVVLGSGLGVFADYLEDAIEFPFSSFADWPAPTALGHSGKIIFGLLHGRPVIAQVGRYHLYEGHSLDLVTTPVQLYRELGVERVILSNAAGGLNPKFRLGNLMVLTDVIDFMNRGIVPSASLEARQLRESVDAQSPIMANRSIRCETSQICDESINNELQVLARRLNIDLQTGVYVGMSGPSYETRAEYRFLRRIGGDVVGMSTIPELYACRRLGIPATAVSVVTNISSPDVRVINDADEVIQVASRSARAFADLVSAFVGLH